MYQVGQVLFIILNKKQQVIPVQVTEQVVRRSLNGEEISYSVSIPNRDGDRALELDSIDGEVFDSIEDVKKTMFEHANYVISTITDKALTIAKKRFDYDNLSTSPEISDLDTTLMVSGPPKDSNDKSVKVKLEDGTIANVKMPDIPLNEI